MKRDRTLERLEIGQSRGVVGDRSSIGTVVRESVEFGERTNWHNLRRGEGANSAITFLGSIMEMLCSSFGKVGGEEHWWR